MNAGRDHTGHFTEEESQILAQDPTRAVLPQKETPGFTGVQGRRVQSNQ